MVVIINKKDILIYIGVGSDYYVVCKEIIIDLFKEVI